MTTLRQVSATQANKTVSINENFQAASPAAMFAVDSAATLGLTFAYYGGIIGDAGLFYQVANGSLSLPNNQANVYIEASFQSGSPDGWVVSYNTSGFTRGAGAIPLYRCTTAGGAITVIDDYRVLIGRQARMRVLTPAFNASLAINWNGVAEIRVTLTGTFSPSFAGAEDGQRVILSLKQDATGSRAVNLPANVRFSDDLSGYTPSAGANKMDRLAFIYHGADDKYDLVAVNKGY